MWKLNASLVGMLLDLSDWKSLLVTFALNFHLRNKMHFVERSK